MAFIGIDVSKNKLDVLWLRQVQPQKVKTRVFPNHPSSLGEVGQWLSRQTGEAPESLHVVMEATSIYHEHLAYALHAAGIRVYVANPARVKELPVARAYSTRRTSMMPWYWRCMYVRNIPG